MGTKPSLYACSLMASVLALAPATLADDATDEMERYITTETVCIGLTDAQEELISKETPITIRGPKLCAWAGIAWETFDDCGEPPTDYSVCAAPIGEAGGGSHGGWGYALFFHDIRSDIGGCEWGDALSLLTWDDCSERLEHGAPHWHDTRDASEDCHFLTSEATNERYGTVLAEDETCGGDIDTDFLIDILKK